MSDSGVLVVNRWRRYGKDRLYVATADETPIGWWDLLTDEAHPKTPELLASLTTAVSTWKAAGTKPESEDVPGTVVAAPTGPEVESPWVDLATNRPGEAVRDRADSEFVAAPLRTTFARLLGVHTEEAGWRRDADGEERVGDQLAKVVGTDPRWAFLHSIPVGNRGSDIDHLALTDSVIRSGRPSDHFV